MDKSIIYLGAGDNLSEEDKKDRLYTIGFIVVIGIIFVILAVVVGGSYLTGSSSNATVKPNLTPTPIQAVKSASDQQLLPVDTTLVPTDTTTPTSIPVATKTPTPTSAPTSVPTNTPTPAPTSSPTPTNTPAPTPTITPTPDPTPGS